MKELKLEQKSPAWLAARSNYFCASDAAPMIGASKHTKRSELLRMKATGDVKEFSDWAQKNLIDKGHAAEYKARELAEEMVGQELYPVTATDDAGVYLASLDGLTMDESIAWENKLWNEELAKAVRAGELPASHYWQLEHILLVTGANYVLFTTTDGTKERFAHLEYRAVPGRREQLMSGWRQFAEDLANYKPNETAPAATGKALIALPPLNIQLVGEVKASNLVLYRNNALTYIEAINTNLQTDQDFADAESTVKDCEDAEKKLDLAKQMALSQTADIDALFRTMDEIREAFRAKRLDLSKRVTARKQEIRNEIRAIGDEAYAAHIRGLNERLGKPYMPHVPVDFGAAMSGKKTVASLRDAVDTELARAKIAANEVADKIQVNLNLLRDKAANHHFLFHDAKDIVLKAPDDLGRLVTQRIADHDAAEAKKRQEEAAKAAPPPPVQQPAAAAPPPPAHPAAAPLPPDATPVERARGFLQSFLEEFGKVQELATLNATIRSFLNSTGRKRKTA